MIDWLKRQKAAPIDNANRAAFASFLSDLHSAFSIEDLSNDPETLLRLGYSNPTVKSCINLIATTASRIPYKVEYKNQKFERMVRPVFRTFGDKLYNIMQLHLLHGLAVVHTPKGSTIDSLVMPAAQIDTTLNNKAGIKVVIVQGSTHGPREFMGRQLEELFLFIDQGARGDPYKAQPIAFIIGDAIVVNSAAYTFYKAYLKRGATFGGILSPKDKEQELDEEQAKVLKAALHSAGGANNALDTLIMTSGAMEYKQLGGNAKDAMVIQLLNDTTLQIASAFGVPPTLIGAKGSQTYANVSEARVALYMNTVLPLLERFYSQFSYHLSVMAVGKEAIGDEICVKVSEKDVPVLQEYRATRMQKWAGVGFLTPNEKRAEFGFEEVEGGDVLMEEEDKNPQPPEANPQPVPKPPSDE